MIKAVLVSVFLGALFFALEQRGKWKARARAAEEQNRLNRKAHDIQNDIVRDGNFRERVRRYFGGP